MISHIFIVKIDRESRDRSWFWLMEKERSVIYRPCCIIFTLTQNTSFEAKLHFSSGLFVQSVLFVCIRLCIYVYIYVGTHTPVYTQI